MSGMEKDMAFSRQIRIIIWFLTAIVIPMIISVTIHSNAWFRNEDIRTVLLTIFIISVICASVLVSIIHDRVKNSKVIRINTMFELVIATEVGLTLAYWLWAH